MMTFKPLWKTLIDKDMKRSELVSLAGLSSQAIAAMGKDETVSLKTIEKICAALHCRVQDVIEYREEKSMTKYRVEYQSGESRNGNKAVDWMMARIPQEEGEDIELYAETDPIDGVEDGTYETLKAEILDQAAEKGIPSESLKFWYDRA